MDDDDLPPGDEELGLNTHGAPETEPGAVDAGDVALRDHLAQCDEVVARAFAPIHEFIDEQIRSRDLRDATRDVVDAQMDIARLAWRRTIYSIWSRTDLVSVGAPLTLEIARLLRQLSHVRRDLRERNRSRPRSAPLVLEHIGRPSGHDTSATVRRANQAIDGASVAIQEFDVLVRKAEFRFRWMDRFRHIGLVLSLARTTLAFNAFKLAVFTLTATAVSKASSVPFSSFGWKGDLIGVLVGYIAVHFGLNPVLNRRFGSRLERALRRLALGVTRTCCDISMTKASLARVAELRSKG
jgi:hypothetical protein